MAKAKTALGVELASDEIRLVLVENGEKGLSTLATQTLRATDDLARAIRSLPRRPQGVVCAVPLEHAALRILSLPPTTDENLERVVTLEAEGVLPLRSEELALSYHMMGMTEQSRLEVLLAAARQSTVQDVLKRVNCLPWVSAEATVTAVALLNALQHRAGAAREPVCAILRIEAAESELLVLDRSRVLVAQRMPVGCGLETPVARQAVPAGGEGASVSTLQSPPAPWLDTLSQQVRYSLQALSYERGLTIDRLYLCGKGGAHPDASWRLSDLLDLRIATLVPEAERGVEEAPYAVAYGCALQAAGLAAVPLNLTPARVTVAREVEQRRQRGASWGALVGAAAAAMGLVFGAAVHSKQQAVAASEARLRELNIEVKAPPLPPKELKAALTAVDDALTPRVPAARLISLLSRLLPTGTWLAELAYNPETGCTIRGFSTDQGGAQASQIALLRQRLFDEVTLDYRTEDKVAGVPVWGFQLTCKLRPRELKQRGRTTSRGGTGR